MANKLIIDCKSHVTSIRLNFDQDEFQFTWINSDTLRICYSVNGA